MSPIEVHDPALKALLGEARFFSITYRLFKLPEHLETLCEDYGQVHLLKRIGCFLFVSLTSNSLKDLWKSHTGHSEPTGRRV